MNYNKIAKEKLLYAFEKAINEQKEIVHNLQYAFDHDPRMEVLKIENEFAELLKIYTGKGRLEKDYSDKVQELSKRQNEWRKKIDGYYFVGISNKLAEEQLLLSSMQTEIRFFKWLLGL